MKKILFIMPLYSIAVDFSMGGAVEMLKKILIEKNETEKQFEFYFISPCDIKNEYSLTKVFVIKKTNFADKIKRLVCYPLRKLKIIDGYTTSYYEKAFKISKKLQPDKIIFSNSYMPNIKKFAKEFGKEKLFYHVHHQVEDKKDISKYFGNLISVSSFIEDDWKNSKINTNQINYYTLRNCLSTQNFTKKEVKDFEKNKKAQLELKESLGFNKDDFIVTYCGRIKKYKGVTNLVEAFSYIKNPKIKLLIIGGSNFSDSITDEYVKSILNKVKTSNGRIKSLGYIPNNELHKYYLISDIHVIPSQYEEAAGIVALESRALGISQIISDSGGLPEYANPNAVIVKRGENFSIELADEINKIYNSKKKQCLPEIVYDENFFYKEFKKIMEK